MAASTTEGLALYYYSTCFYCIRVRRAIAKLGLQVEERNIHEDRQYRSELVDNRGRGTVPVLRIEEPDGSVRWLGESRDIVEYLTQRFGGQRDAEGSAAPGRLRRLLPW